MRLINCSTLHLETFFGDKIPKYAILSHTWGDEEVSFADLPFDQLTKARAGYQKIVLTCEQAIRDGLDYAWVDTCCIDKSSSPELSEAINSMFAWYQKSTRCYAYLSDVDEANMIEDFPKSRWFTRGWTLQELLAPKDVIFYDRQWNELGKKSDHADWISKIAGIDPKALLPDPDTNDESISLRSFCVAKKMSWASRRETRHREDIAYCLLGIFDVRMSLLYGEGDQAFLRLQEEIIRRTDDDSILAWGLEPKMDHPQRKVSEDLKFEMTEYIEESNSLASSPKDFIDCANFRYTPGSISPFTLTNVGLQIRLPLVSVYQAHDNFDSPLGGSWLGLLSCSLGTSHEFLGIPLVPDPNNDGAISRMSRVVVSGQSGSQYTSTLIFGPRTAVRSIHREIIITRSSKGVSSNVWGHKKGLASYCWGYRYIIIKESRKLRKLGYQVKRTWTSKGIRYDGDEDDFYSTWDDETLTLTIQKHGSFESMFEFCVRQKWADEISTITMFAHIASNSVTLRQGYNLSKDDLQSTYQCLVRRSTQDEDDSILIPGGNGRMLKVSAKITRTRVYRHQIFEIVIKAVEVATSNLQC